MALLVLFACVAEGAEEATLSAEEAAAAKRTADRMRVCKNDSDCLTIKTKKGTTFVVDGLDFERDSVKDIEAKLPATFGPRPAVYLLRLERLLNDHETLAEQTAVVGDVVHMYKESNWDAEL